MTLNTQARLSGIAGCLPSQRVTSADWDRHFNLPAGHIARQTGIDQRFRCGPHEDANTMAAAAISEALAQARLQPKNIGLVIECSACLQQPLPGNAACLLETLGTDWWGIPGIDVRNTCLGFLAALHVAQALVATHGHILVVSSETPFNGLDLSDQQCAPLFGEGAAAAIISPARTPRAYYYAMETFAEHRSSCQVEAGGHRLPPYAYSQDNDARFRFQMNGRVLHKIASQRLPGLVLKFRQNWVNSAALCWIPHPASGPAVELMKRRLELPADRVFCTLSAHGNMISAGIPYQLAQARAAGLASSFVAVGTAAGYSQAILAWADCDAP